MGRFYKIQSYITQFVNFILFYEKSDFFRLRYDTYAEGPTFHNLWQVGIKSDYPTKSKDSSCIIFYPTFPTISLTLLSENETRSCMY